MDLQETHCEVPVPSSVVELKGPDDSSTSAVSLYLTLSSYPDSDSN